MVKFLAQFFTLQSEMVNHLLKRVLYRHSIGVLWFLGVLWTSGKVSCDHCDMSGECSQKIKCSHEKKLVILV